MADRRKSTTTRLRTAKNRRRIVVSFFFLPLSLCTQGRWTRISEADDSAATHASYATNTGTTRCARDISRTRLTLPRTHACDLVHARVFFLLFFRALGALRNRLVSSDGISNTSSRTVWKIRRIFWEPLRIVEFTRLRSSFSRIV